MSDNRQEPSKHRLIDYNHLSTDELSNLINKSFYEDNVDEETLDVMLDVYLKRDGAPVSDVDAAWERFQREYAGNAEHVDTDKTRQTARGGEYKQVRWRKRISRLSLSALIGILVTIILLSSAVGASIFYLMRPQWTDDKFSFTDTQSVELQSLHEVLKSHNIVALIVPTWIPDEFLLINLSIHPSPKNTLYIAHFYSGEKSLTIQISELSEPFSNDYEKDSELVMFYECNDIKHYMMTNNDQLVVTWTYETYECMITGDITEDEMTLMINSIYKG